MASSDSQQREWQMGTLPAKGNEMTGGAADVNLQSSTIKDVARLAGVSTATVSRVVNGSGSVSSMARSKVLTAVSGLQYQPNAYAAGLGRVSGHMRRNRGMNLPGLATRAS